MFSIRYEQTFVSWYHNERSKTGIFPCRAIEHIWASVEIWWNFPFGFPSAYENLIYH